jgi:D-alanyl-D-alanine carboxypeptidase
MARGRVWVVGALLCAALAGCASRAPARVTPAGFSPQDTQRIDAAARSALTGGATAVIVGISDPGRGLFLRSYGAADTTGAALPPDARYRIASVTKTFTADAVLRLVDQGKVALTDPITKYVPGFPTGDRITVRDLLAMRSGIYDYVNDPAFFARYLADPTWPGWTPEQAVRIMSAHAAEFTAPDRVTKYCNSNYVLLGYVVEKASGQPVAGYLDGVARSAGLAATTYPTTDTLPAPFVHGYLGDGNPGPPGATPRDMTASNPEVAGPAGAVVSTVPDMLRWATALGTGQGLTPATWRLRQTWSPLSSSGVRVEYGLGITRLGDWLGHDGSIFGYSTLVFYLPSRRVSMVVMSNAADANAVPAQAPWGQIAKQLYPDSLPSWP